MEGTLEMLWIDTVELLLKQIPKRPQNYTVCLSLGLKPLSHQSLKLLS